MAIEDNPISPADSEPDFSLIPADFPKPAYVSTVPGARVKFTSTEYKGRFYPAGGSPPELYERWLHCEDLARQFADSSLSTKAGKRAHMAEADILDQYLMRLIAAQWTSRPEARWVIRRAAALINWPAPQAAIEPSHPASPDDAHAH